MNTDFQYTLEFYKMLDEKASTEVIDGVELTVFRGYLTKTFQGMGVSQSYYSRVITALKELGCITILKRGARGVDSLIAINHPPDEMEFTVRSSTPLTSSPQAAKLAEQVADLQTRLGGLNIAEAIEYLDIELKSLAKRVKTLERNTGG